MGGQGEGAQEFLEHGLVGRVDLRKADPVGCPARRRAREAGPEDLPLGAHGAEGGPQPEPEVGAFRKSLGQLDAEPPAERSRDQPASA
jgi:hypothetical protein